MPEVTVKPGEAHQWVKGNSWLEAGRDMAASVADTFANIRSHIERYFPEDIYQFKNFMFKFKTESAKYRDINMAFTNLVRRVRATRDDFDHLKDIILTAKDDGGLHGGTVAELRALVGQRVLGRVLEKRVVDFYEGARPIFDELFAIGLGIDVKGVASHPKYRELYYPKISKRSPFVFSQLFPEMDNALLAHDVRLDGLGFVKYHQSAGADGVMNLLDSFHGYSKKMIFGDREGGSFSQAHDLLKHYNKVSNAGGSKLTARQKNALELAKSQLETRLSLTKGEPAYGEGALASSIAKIAEKVRGAMTGRGDSDARIGRLETAKAAWLDAHSNLDEFVKSIYERDLKFDGKAMRGDRAIKKANAAIKNGKDPATLDPDLMAARAEVERLRKKEGDASRALVAASREAPAYMNSVGLTTNKPIAAIADMAMTSFYTAVLGFKIGRHTVASELDLLQGVASLSQGLPMEVRKGLINAAVRAQPEAFRQFKGKLTGALSYLNDDYKMFDPDVSKGLLDELTVGAPYQGGGIFKPHSVTISPLNILDSHAKSRHIPDVRAPGVPVWQHMKQMFADGRLGEAVRNKFGGAADGMLDTSIFTLSTWDHTMSKVVSDWADAHFRREWQKRKKKGGYEADWDGFANDLAPKMRNTDRHAIADAIERMAEHDPNKARDMFVEWAATDVFVGIGKEWQSAAFSGLRGGGGWANLIKQHVTMFTRHPASKLDNALRDPVTGAYYAASGLVLYMLMSQVLGEEEAERYAFYLAGYEVKELSEYMGVSGDARQTISPYTPWGAATQSMGNLEKELGL